MSPREQSYRRPLLAAPAWPTPAERWAEAQATTRRNLQALMARDAARERWCHDVIEQALGRNQ